MSQVVLQKQMVLEKQTVLQNTDHHYKEQHYKLKGQMDLELDYGCSSGDSSDKWQKHLLNAKISWARLTDQELMKSQGSAKKLASLVQQRYALSLLDAEKQVNAFLKKNTVNSNVVSERNYE